MRKGFSQVDKHLEQVGKHFEQVDNRFDQGDKRSTSLEKRLCDKIDESIREFTEIVNNGFDELEGKMNGRFDILESRQDDLDRSMEEIKLKFAYTAWAIDLQELKLRVEKVEDRLKIKRR
jgi:hypothetical protein